VGYRLELKKEIEINRAHQELRNRALLMKEIGFALFGRRRFKRIELVATLNVFYTALKVSTIFHQRVAGLYMIIELEKVQYMEFKDENDKDG